MQSSRQQEIINAVNALFATIDEQTEGLAKATGLHCKTACGKCCENPHIETTVTEMLPMAKHLYDSGQAPAISNTINKQSMCAVYQPDAKGQGLGRCGIYMHRPGICRLFGFAYRKDKQGKKELVTCRIMKEEFTLLTVKAENYLNTGGQAVDITQHTMKVYALDPQWGNQLMPINQALMEAINKIILVKTQTK